MLVAHGNLKNIEKYVIASCHMRCRVVILYVCSTVMVSHVGYKADKQDQLSPLEHAFAGAASGAISRTLLQPLDVLKIRFQVSLC